MVVPRFMMPLLLAQVEQEASELNKLRRKVVRRVEDLLQLEFEVGTAVLGGVLRL